VQDIVRMEEGMVEMLSTLPSAPSVPEINSHRNASIVGLSAAVVTDCPDPLRHSRDLDPLRKVLRILEDSSRTERNPFMKNCHTTEKKLLEKYIKRLEDCLAHRETSNGEVAKILPGNSDIVTETAEKSISKKNLLDLLVVGMSAVNLRFGALNKNSGLYPLIMKVETAIKEGINRLMAVLPDSISSHQQIAHVMPALLQIAAESIFKYIYRGQEKFSLEQSRLDVVGNYRVAFEAMNKEIQSCFPVPIASLEQIGREAQPKVQILSQHEKDGMETYIKQHSAYEKEHEDVYKRYHAFQHLAQYLLPDDVTPEMLDWFLRGVDETRNAILVHCEKRKIPQYEAICVTMKNNAKTLRDTAAGFFPGNPLFADTPRIAAADLTLSSEREVSSPSITRDELIALFEEKVFSDLSGKAENMLNTWREEKGELPEIISAENYTCLRQLSGLCFNVLPRIQNSGCRPDIARILSASVVVPRDKYPKEMMDAVMKIEQSAQSTFATLQKKFGIPTISFQTYNDTLGESMQLLATRYFPSNSARFMTARENLEDVQSITNIGKEIQNSMPERLDILQVRFINDRCLLAQVALCEIAFRSSSELGGQYKKMIKALTKEMEKHVAQHFPGHSTAKLQGMTMKPDKEPVVSNGYDQLPDVSIWSADTTFASTLPENFEEGLYHIEDLNPTTLEAKIQQIFKTVKEDKTIGETLGIETKALAIVIPLLSRFRRIAKTVVTDFNGPISTLYQYQKIKAGFGFALQSLTGPHADSLKEYISQHFLRPWFTDIETRVSATIPAHEHEPGTQAHEALPKSVDVPGSSDVVEQGEKGVVSSMRRNTTALLGDFEGFSMITKEAFGLALRYAFERVVLKTEDAVALESLFVSAEGEQCFATYEAFNDRRTELISELRSMVTSEDGVRFSQALRAAFAVFQSTLTAADGPLGTRISTSYEKAFSYLESSLNVYFSPSA